MAWRARSRIPDARAAPSARDSADMIRKGQPTKLPPLSRRRYSGRAGALSLRLAREHTTPPCLVPTLEKSSAQFSPLSHYEEKSLALPGPSETQAESEESGSGGGRGRVEERSPAKKTFRSLARMVKNQVVWAKSLQQAEQHLKTHVVRDDGSELNLTFNVTSFRPDIQACGELSPQAKNILMKPSPSRTDKELQFLHRFTLQLKCFECYSVYVRKELARVLLYKAFEKGRVIIRQGDIGFSLYFILSGSVFVEVQEEDQVTGKKHNQIVHELETGAAFGELALLQDSRRKATIVCKENSEFLTIDKPDFDMVLRKNHEREWNAQLAYFKKHPIFAEWNPSSLKFAVEGSQIVAFPPNTVILNDLSANSDHVFFVMQGQCQVVQRVEVNRDRNSLCIGQQTFPLPNILDGSCERADQQCMHSRGKKLPGSKKWWVVRLLLPGDCFGMGEGREGMSVLSDHKVECLLVNKIAFMRHNRGKCLLHLKEEIAMLYPSSETVLCSYVETKKWNMYKESVLLESVYRIRGSRNKKHIRCKLPDIS